MKSSSCRSLEVFDFKEEDELPEIAAGKYLGKFRNSSVDDHSGLKCKFLECGMLVIILSEFLVPSV